METARVDICYRPLHVASAIHSTGKEGFRRMARLSHTLWGDRFNPVSRECRVVHRPLGDAMLKTVRGKYEARAIAPKQFQFVWCGLHRTRSR
jgi:hypothetical protein